MKTLLWMGAGVALLLVVVVFVMLRDPAAGIVGVSDSGSSAGRSFIVLHRDGTFEQFLTPKGMSKVTLNTGTWADAANDPDSQMFMAQTHQNLSEPYLNLKGTISLDAGSGQTKEVLALVPQSSYQTPNEQQLAEIGTPRQGPLTR